MCRHKSASATTITTHTLIFICETFASTYAPAGPYCSAYQLLFLYFLSSLSTLHLCCFLLSALVIAAVVYLSLFTTPWRPLLAGVCLQLLLRFVFGLFCAVLTFNFFACDFSAILHCFFVWFIARMICEYLSSGPNMVYIHMCTRVLVVATYICVVVILAESCFIYVCDCFFFIFVVAVLRGHSFMMTLLLYCAHIDTLLSVCLFLFVCLTLVYCLW